MSLTPKAIDPQLAGVTPAQFRQSVPCKDFLGYVYDIARILRGGDPRTITPGHLDQMVYRLSHVYKIREIQASFVITMAEKNNYYRQLIHGDLLANPLMRSLSHFIANFVAKRTRSFHVGGRDNMHFRDIKEVF